MIITIILIVVVGVAGFFGGMQYQKSQRGNGAFSDQGFVRRMGNTQNANSAAMRGQVIGSDDKSITVKLQDGSSKILLLAGSTTITEATSATKQALQNGTAISAFGTSNSDGSVTAQNIQINPQQGRPGAPGQ